MTNNTKRRRRTVRKYGPDPIDMHVGQRLRHGRILAGLSQSELGEGIGVSFQALQKYEMGDIRLSASRLHAAAKFLQCEEAFFFEGVKPTAKSRRSEPFVKSEVELIRSLREIEDEGLRDALYELVRELGALRSSEAE